MAEARQSEEGMDILKFFIAIMSFLTVLVAGMAGYNWSRATSLAEEIEGDLARLEQVKKIAGSKDFKDMVAKDLASKDLVDVLNQDLGQYLQQVATGMNLTLVNYEKVSSGGQKQQGFSKFSYRFTIDKQPLSKATDYLFHLQRAWPGLKIEEIQVQEAQRLKKDDPFPDWKTTVLVSVFRPKE